MVKANDFVTSGGIRFPIKLGGSIKDLLWKAANLRNENWQKKFRKMELTKSDNFMDLEDVMNRYTLFRNFLEFMVLGDKDKFLVYNKLIEEKCHL